MYKEKSGGFPSAFSRKQRLLVCHVLFDFFDHLLDHIAADIAGFLRSQIAVVALLEVDADLVCDFILHVVHFLLGRCRIDGELVAWR